MLWDSDMSICWFLIRSINFLFLALVSAIAESDREISDIIL